LATRGWIMTDEEIRKYLLKRDDILNQGAFFNLVQQLNKLAKHCKDNVAIKSQRQYYSNMLGFIHHLSDYWGLQNLANISGKHVAAYIEELQSEGKSASTVDSHLCAIRYFHDQFGKDQARHKIPDNSMLCRNYGISLEPRMFGGVNRRWTWSEVEKMVQLAMVRNRFDISHMIQLAAGLGLRIHEVVRLSREVAVNAIRTGSIHVKGKGGLERVVPVNAAQLGLLKAIIVDVPKGAKLFVLEGRKAHEVIQSVQSFIINHRDSVADPTARPQGVNMTFHGLRHLYAYERYQEFLKEGFAPAAARLKVAQLIGHNRDDVTRIYLAE
jgi:integrase/recombinase XerD